MAKNLKLNIKNTQLAKVAGLDKLKAKLSKKTEATEPEDASKKASSVPPPSEVEEQKPTRIRARSKSSFAPDEKAPSESPPPPPQLKEAQEPDVATPSPQMVEQEVSAERFERLGPTGRHVNDLLPQKPKVVEPVKETVKPGEEKKTKEEPKVKEDLKPKEQVKVKEEEAKKEVKKGKVLRDFKDLKPARRQGLKPFDARARQGLGESEEDRWRKKRSSKFQVVREEQIDRPTKLKIRLPISIKDLSVEMKLKSSEVIQKLFLLGLTFTLNDLIDDATTVEYIGNEFGCEISIDTTEEKRIQITAESIREEISSSDQTQLQMRPPVVAFMGHVDHGKTSLIDTIRKSNVVAGEAGAITQHIGAFRCKTAVGDITILDTPGHEAFSSMRARGADVTDIVVLVVAGDEGMREQTVEALQHAKSAGVTIVVALNKCDKPNFNPENVYRQLSEHSLLPEAWGGSTITVNTSAATGEGIPALLEMLALQAEVLELRANPMMRARGTVLESELHKGRGAVSTVLVQNGTLHLGDPIVFERHWGRVKTMHDEQGNLLQTATPSTPVEITGLSGIPAAGDPFIVVKSEKEARSIISAREVGRESRALQQKKVLSLETLLQEGVGKKSLKLILRADMQGSIEALKTSLLKIHSDKVDVDLIFTGIGEVSESDIELASASNAVIIGFHTAIESHAELLIKELGVIVRLFDVIYHAVDAVKLLMQGLLDKIEQENEMGSAEVKAVFKSSQLGAIAGCQVIEGVINRNNRMRVVRDDKVIWKGRIGSIKRVKEDVKEVKKGIECGILVEGFSDYQVGDILQAYDITYITQEI